MATCLDPRAPAQPHRPPHGPQSRKQLRSWVRRSTFPHVRPEDAMTNPAASAYTPWGNDSHALVVSIDGRPLQRWPISRSGLIICSDIGIYVFQDKPEMLPESGRAYAWCEHSQSLDIFSSADVQGVSFSGDCWTHATKPSGCIISKCNALSGTSCAVTILMVSGPDRDYSDDCGGNLKVSNCDNTGGQRIRLPLNWSCISFLLATCQ